LRLRIPIHHGLCSLSLSLSLSHTHTHTHTQSDGFGNLASNEYGSRNKARTEVRTMRKKVVTTRASRAAEMHKDAITRV
jgi:hypothetical protein